jgi:ribonuclease HI
MATDHELETIVSLIRRLTPAARRQLLRRLRLSGLLPAETEQTDRNRLTVAPALGEQAERSHPLSNDRRAAPSPSRTTAPLTAGAPAGASGNARTPASGGSPSAPPANSAAPLALHMAATDAPTGRRVNGKVVIGVPDNKENSLDPHAVAPLPGLAPEQPISIVFDGGSKGNPGLGYGSYALRWPGQPQQIVQLQFGDGVTNNEAEYDTLIAAVEAVLKRLRDIKADPTTAHVDIRGDSQLVINQVTGEWKCSEERLRPRRDRVRNLLRELGHWQLIYHPRENSVRILGH